MNLEACLPSELRTPTTTITRVAAGQSGAGVYRVEAGDQAFVLKIADERAPIADWRRKVDVQAAAAAAGVAPRVIHVDEARRAVVSAFVIDRSFPILFNDPRTREAAIALLGQTVRRVHDLPVPAGAAPRDPLDLLAAIWSGLPDGFAPGFVADAVAGIRAEARPATDRALVLSHNDVNPSNLVYDGEHLRLLDWETAAPNEPLYDLATIAVFLRMDDATCLRLLAAHDGAPADALPDRFVYDRRLIAVLCGAAFLHVARLRGHAGATGETLASTPPLPDFYQRLRTGGVNLGHPDGQWAFGLALVHASTTL